MKIKFTVCLLGLLFIYSISACASISVLRRYCPQSIICTGDHDKGDFRCNINTSSWKIKDITIDASAGTYNLIEVDALRLTTRNEIAQCLYYIESGKKPADIILRSINPTFNLSPDLQRGVWTGNSNSNYRMCMPSGQSMQTLDCPFIINPLMKD